MASQRVSTTTTQRSGADRVSSTVAGTQRQDQRQTSNRTNASTRKGSQQGTRKSQRLQAAQAVSTQLETAQANEVQVQKAHTQVQRSRPGVTFATTFDDIAISISGTIVYSVGLGVRPAAVA